MVAKYLNLYYIVYWYCYIVKANGKNVKAIISYYVIRSRNFEANFLSIEKINTQRRPDVSMYWCKKAPRFHGSIPREEYLIKRNL